MPKINVNTNANIESYVMIEGGFEKNEQEQIPEPTLGRSTLRTSKKYKLFWKEKNKKLEKKINISAYESVENSQIDSDEKLSLTQFPTSKPTQMQPHTATSSSINTTSANLNTSSSIVERNLEKTPPCEEFSFSYYKHGLISRFFNRILPSTSSEPKFNPSSSSNANTNLQTCILNNKIQLNFSDKFISLHLENELFDILSQCLDKAKEINADKPSFMVECLIIHCKLLNKLLDKSLNKDQKQQNIDSKEINDWKTVLLSLKVFINALDKFNLDVQVDKVLDSIDKTYVDCDKL